MKTLWFDSETYSECDLKTHGTHRYAEHPSTEILIVQWAVNDEEPIVVDMTGPDWMRAERLKELLADPGVVVVAHSSHFDRTLLRHVWGIDVPIERWRDTMVQALAHGLPGGLEKIAHALGLPHEESKDKRGRDLIQLFCKPRPINHKLRRATRETHPAEWQEFLEYSRQDVLAMRHIARKLPSWNYRGGHPELALWHLDQRINDRGFLVDLDLARAAIAAVATEQHRLKAETRAATAGNVSSPSKRDELLAYILSEYGVLLPDMKADTLRRRLDDPELPDGVKLLISLRLEATKTGTAKYKALIKATSADGRLRNTLQFAGAQRTARWAGRIFQPQNMMRPTMEAEAIEFGIEAMKADSAELFFDNIMDLAGNAVRGCIVAPPGKKLVVADLANIEGRMLAWLAGEEWKVQAFRDYDAGTGPDLYKLAYARSFNVEPDAVTKPQRQIGKVEELALGYMGGVGAFVTFAAVYGMDLDELADAVHSVAPKEQLAAAYGMWDWAERKKRTLGLSRSVYTACETIKAAWRAAHPATVALAQDLENAVREAILNPKIQVDVGKLKVQRDGAWLRIRLPSGRCLCYVQPKVDEEGGISYAGVNQYTRQWGRIKTFGGKLVENCIAGGTEVLTRTGWVTIEKVTAEHQVWDGEEWVAHRGLVAKGEQPVIDRFGIWLTPDHRILTTQGWKHAAACEGLDRAPCRLPDSDAQPGERREEDALGSEVRLRRLYTLTWFGIDQAAEAGDCCLVRVYEREDYCPSPHYTRDVEAPGVLGLAVDARSLPATDASGVEELRGTRNSRVLRMAELRALLDRDGPDVRPRADAGTTRQRPWVLVRQLLLGNLQSAGGEHTQHSTCRDTEGAATCVRGSRHLWGEAHDAALPTGSRLADQPRARPVFDLMDCGPRQRFVVRGSDGPVIVHNCTQAAARDVLAANMQAVEDAGYPLVIHVHDELITEVPDTADFSSNELARLMSQVPPWAEGLPLAAAGFECARYRKE